MNTYIFLSAQMFIYITDIMYMYNKKSFRKSHFYFKHCNMQIFPTTIQYTHMLLWSLNHNAIFETIYLFLLLYMQVSQRWIINYMHYWITVWFYLIFWRKYLCMYVCTIYNIIRLVECRSLIELTTFFAMFEGV